jgi:hypothetical protein
MKTRRRHARRQGNVLVLTAFMMLGMMALLAFSIDLGYLYVARTELQRSADAAAMAAAWELLEDDAVFGNETNSQTDERARETAAEYASFNRILSSEPDLATNDVEVGYVDDPWNPNESINPNGSGYNAVRVRVQRTSGQNGAIPMLFGRVLGVDETALEAEAMAVTYSNFGGFQLSSDGDDTLPILPFALDLETWNAMMAGGGSDQWSWNGTSVVAGSDGMREINLFPQATGSPGNRGTVDIGSSNNSTSDLCQQIRYGISEEDLEYHGGKLELDENGELDLGGDPGISAGTKDDLAAIKGEPRIIPIFASVAGNGNNAVYTIVQFVGVRILDVKLTGSNNSKRVIIQPAKVLIRGGIPRTDVQSSYFVYSPVWLVR